MFCKSKVINSLKPNIFLASVGQKSTWAAIDWLCKWPFVSFLTDATMIMNWYMHVCHIWHMHCISVITTMDHNILFWQQNSKGVKASNIYIHVFKMFNFFTYIFTNIHVFHIFSQKSTFSATCFPPSVVLTPCLKRNMIV